MSAQPNVLRSFLPITSLQPEHYHAIAHSFPQRQPTNPPIIKGLRTLSIVTGVVHPCHFSEGTGPSIELSPLESAFTPNGRVTLLESAFTRILGWQGSVRPNQNRRATYSRIMCFQYGQSCPPSGPQLSSEWRMPFPASTSDRRYDGPEFSHCPVPVAI